MKGSGSCHVSELGSKVPVDSARYHLFRFQHTYEGDSFNSNGERDKLVTSEKKFIVLVFIYSMPGYSVSIKERMLYSSCKNSVVDVLEKVYSIIVNKKIEVDSGAELTEEYLLVRLHQNCKRLIKIL